MDLQLQAAVEEMSDRDFRQRQYYQKPFLRCRVDKNDVKQESDKAWRNGSTWGLNLLVHAFSEKAPSQIIKEYTTKVRG